MNTTYSTGSTENPEVLRAWSSARHGRTITADTRTAAEKPQIKLLRVIFI